MFCLPTLQWLIELEYFISLKFRCKEAKEEMHLTREVVFRNNDNN